MLLSFVDGLPEYYAFCVLLGIGCASVSLVPTSILIAPWFLTKRGLAIGAMNAGVGIAGLIAPNLSRFVIERWGLHRRFSRWPRASGDPICADVASGAVRSPRGFAGSRCLPGGRSPQDANVLGVRLKPVFRRTR